MRDIRLIVVAFTLLFFMACSKKTHPSKNAAIIYNEENPVTKTEEKTNTPSTVPASKPLSPKKEKQLFPETIYVNDAAAKKSVDGRLYYDVEGHRYWKNYKDGKYYLFNKSIYNNPDFKPPVKDND